ncbi:MAG: DUF1800 family protein [Verrucomicrobiota bacterium]
MNRRILSGLLTGLVLAVNTAYAQLETPPPAITSMVSSNGQRILGFTPYPAANQIRLLSSTNLVNGFTLVTNASMTNFNWFVPATASNAFYLLEVLPLSTNAQIATIALNRLAYGPTPKLLDDLVYGGNPQAAQDWVTSQLAPETIAENIANSHTNINIIEGKFGSASTYISHTATDGPGTAHINDLRAWFVLHAVGADRQLVEVLSQFCENHFVTQYSKTYDYFTSFYNGITNARERIAAELERREMERWRQVLLDPNGTFLDLLTVSAESPAMIIYLDTVNSRADGGRIPNENYARELLELFTLGVDNGYDQNDIVALSYAWAGWSVEMVATNNWNNPHAAKTTTLLDTGNPSTAYTNLIGSWVLNFKNTRFRTNAITVFPGKMVPARYGEPWVSKTYANATPGSYQLVIPSRSGTAAMQSGYDALNHLANLPFTQEYISVKLCRLLVHDDFHHGYDFTDEEVTPEEALVKQCMLAWENSTPKGKLRPVLSTIVNSDLFRSQYTAFQKVKTPLEFAVSAIRALRYSTNNAGPDTFTADTDGYSISGATNQVSATPSLAPLSRMGGMYLFERSDPDGYPEGSAGWISAGTLAERLRYAQSICIALTQSGKTDAGNGNIVNPVAFVQNRLPSPDWRDAGKVADLFISMIYPGEGQANLTAYRTAAINFLNTSDSGTSSLFSSLTVSTTANSTYDNRVRGLVGMLFTFQRFQEQ